MRYSRRMRLLSTLLALVMLLTIVPLPAAFAGWSDPVADGGVWNYVLNSDGKDTVTLTGYLGSYENGTVEIPASVTVEGKTKTVTAIANTSDAVFGGSSLQENEKLKKVTFANGSQVKTVGARAFAYCSMLESVELPATVTAIGPYAFKNAGSALSEGLSLKLPAVLTDISDRTFENAKLASITIPSGVKTIPERAFLSCNMKSIDLGNVVTINDSAFWNSGLETVTIPKSVTSIGKSAFSGWYLTDVYYEGTKAEFEGKFGSLSTVKSDSFNAKTTFHFQTTVTFKNSDGTNLKTVPCMTNDLLSTITDKPNPTNPGRELLGWAETPNAAKALDESTEKITEGMTLYPVWSKLELKAADFTFTEPTDLEYDGKPKTAKLEPGSSIQTGEIGNITLTYYKNGVETKPIEAGTYTVKAKVAEGSEYKAATLSDDSWTFTITHHYSITAKDCTVTDNKAEAGAEVVANAAITAADGEYLVWSVERDDTGENVEFDYDSPEKTAIRFKMPAADVTVTVQTVLQGELTAEMFDFAQPESLIADGSAKQASVTPNANLPFDESKVSVTLHYYDETGTEVPEAVNAGTYTVRIDATVTDAGDYTGTHRLTDDAWKFTLVVQEYSITTKDCTVNVTDNKAEAGAEIVATADAVPEGSYLVWSVKNNDFGEEIAFDYASADRTVIRFKMPAADVLVEAEFVPRGTLTAEMFNFTAPDELTVDGTEKQASVTTNKNLPEDIDPSKVSITLHYYNEAGDEVEHVTEAGTYTVKIDVATGNAEYADVQGMTDDEWKFTLVAQEYSITTKDCTVNVTDSKAEAGAEVVANAAITAADGEYLVWSVERDDTGENVEFDYDSPEKTSIRFKMPAANVTVTVQTVLQGELTAEMFDFAQPESLIADGSAKQASVTPNANLPFDESKVSVTLHYYDETDTEVPEAVNAGTYTVRIDATVTDAGDYTGTHRLTDDAWKFTLKDPDPVDPADPADPGSSGGGDAGDAVVAVVAGAAVGFAAVTAGTEIYLNTSLPEGEKIPSNREELALLLWKDAGRPEPEDTAVFTDLAAESESSKAARWAVETGLMKADSAETFAPGRFVSHYETAWVWFQAQQRKK